MPPSIETRATLDDLGRVEGKAELVGGRIIHLMGSGRRPVRVAGRIFRSLDDHAAAVGRGEANTDGLSFAVTGLASGRESFMPDVSYHSGAFPADEMRRIDGPPTLAVEVRSEHDQGRAAGAAMAAKRADYFEAGTLVVWDVDPVAELIHVHRRDDPGRVTTYARGDVAEAEPAAPGWRIAVAAVFG